MFGYIRPNKPELLVKEYDLYKSAYCGLCKRMGKDYGRLSRLALSYDGTFLAMLSMALRDDCPGFEAGRCVANPAKRCTYCTGHEESYAYAGAVSVLTAYYKIKDDIKDSGFWGKLRSVCLLPFAVRGYHKARKRYPKLDSIVYEYIQAQSKVEQDPQTGIDAAAEPTAVMLRKVLMPVAGGDQIREAIFLQLGYFLGRWIYLIDAADDIEKDQKKNNFNPFVKKLIREREKPLEGEALADYCNGVLNQTLSQIILSYQLLSLRHFDRVISNILTQGLPAMHNLVIYDMKAKREKV